MTIPTGFNSLPFELIPIILEQLISDFSDKVSLQSYISFSITCKTFKDAFLLDATLVLFCYDLYLENSYYLADAKGVEIGNYPFIIKDLFGLNLRKQDIDELAEEHCMSIFQNIRRELALKISAAREEGGSGTDSFEIEVFELRGNEGYGGRDFDAWDALMIHDGLVATETERIFGGEWIDRAQTAFWNWNTVLAGRLTALTRNVLRAKVSCWKCSGTRVELSDEDAADYTNSFPPK